ncbi:MAG: HOG (high osmolarity glycerol) pathway protein [Candelina submexicana]|nr:MAG: HOG (high osmolarity glycerol) pathway protein [Candelina submexicana]
MEASYESSSRSASPKSLSKSTSNPNHPVLPPLITSPPPKHSDTQKPQAGNDGRLSPLSKHSGALDNPSRPPSDVFPIFHSTLPYAIVRDFAYPTIDALHYGPPPVPSETSSTASTPVSETHPDSAEYPWEESRGHWPASTWVDDAFHERAQLPSVMFGDGPPWSEDEDLHSPVVINSRQRKGKSTGDRESEHGRGRERTSIRGNRTDSDFMTPSNYAGVRGPYAETNGDARDGYFHREGDTTANGPGRDSIDYLSERNRNSRLGAPYNVPGQRDSHFATTLPNRSYSQPGAACGPRDSPSEPYDSPGFDRNDSRYSRDYQFTIASPDEEMHGKAVALFDFERENENELPLVEGQVIWVSYRHGQGWLVAEDPKTGESGLVPEEYVRLLRDIEGGWNNEVAEGGSVQQPTSPDESTPTQNEQPQPESSAQSSSTSNGHHRPSIVSTFSTSSKDLNPYPHHLLGTQAGQAPPQVIHYQGQRGGSQVSTPTLASPAEGRGLLGRSGSSKSQDSQRKTDSPTGVRQQSPIRETAVYSDEAEREKP